MAFITAKEVKFPHCERQLVPKLVDQRAEADPDSLYAEYPVSSSSYDEGYHKITYRGLANAVNGAAWWLHRTLGPGKNFEALAYMGPNDLRYTALILAAVKAGYIVMERRQLPQAILHRLQI